MTRAKDIRGRGPLPPKMADHQGRRGSHRAFSTSRSNGMARQELRPPDLPGGPFAKRNQMALRFFCWSSFQSVLESKSKGAATSPASTEPKSCLIGSLPVDSARRRGWRCQAFYS